MSPEERTELLKKVAEVAPEEWQAHEVNDWEWLTFWVPTGEYDRELPPNPYIDICDLVLYDDMRSASAIIAMMDAMEKDGCSTTLKCWDDDINEDKFELEVYPQGWITRCSCCGTSKIRNITISGDTRAEVVAKAFVQVFSGKTHKSENEN